MTANNTIFGFDTQNKNITTVNIYNVSKNWRWRALGCRVIKENLLSHAHEPCESPEAILAFIATLLFAQALFLQDHKIPSWFDRKFRRYSRFSKWYNTHRHRYLAMLYKPKLPGLKLQNF